MRSRPLGVEFTADEAATVARFDAAPDAKESLRERVARAICNSDGVKWDSDHPRQVDTQSLYLANADAAIAVMRGDDA